MNDLKNLTSRIEKEAEDFRMKALADASEESANIKKKYEAMADGVRKEYADKAALVKKDSDTGVSAAVSMQHRNMMLGTKNELIEDVIARAKKRIVALEGKDRAELYAKLAFDALCDKEGGELILCECDSEIAGLILDTVNAAAKSASKPELKLSDKTVKFDCGVIVKYGDLEYNCMLDTMINGSYSELASVAVHGLFA